MPRQIPIFKAEHESGLTELISTQASIAYVAPVEFRTDDSVNVDKAVLSTLTRATNNGQVDLHYLKSILATVGWNKNDDVFDKAEIWLARATPEDKPFNFEHNAKDIIGHITSNFAIDLNSRTIPDNTPVYELPDVFHIAVSSVLYKYWPDKELVERMQKIIDEITKGEWFISMEALFDNFDYAVVDEEGKNYVVARTDASAFLTKHLRVYGGSGQFDNKKVGRLLRNIVFSGKGLVRKPANPHSIIFDSVKAFENYTQLKTLSGYTLSDKKIFNQESNRMPEEVTQLQLLQNENKRLENTLGAAVAAKDQAEKRLTEMNEQTVKAKIDGLTEDVKARDEKINSLNTQVQTEQKARTEAEVKIKELETKNVELQNQVNKVQAETKKVARVAYISTELGKNQAEAQTFYDEHVADLNLNDERFNKLVASYKVPKPAGEQNTETQTTQALESAQSTGKVTPMGADGVQTKVEQTRAGLSKFLTTRLRGNKGE